EVPTLNKNNIQLRVIGDMNMLPVNAQKELNEALQETAPNTGLKLVMALSYSSRWEIARAMKMMAVEIESGALQSKDIHGDTIKNYLDTKDIPDPELMIRTGGEYRVSN